MKTPQLAALLAAALASQAAAQVTGPSSSQSPYLLPYPGVTGVQTVSLITTGDSVNGYRFAGIPDGEGAFRRAGQSRNFALVCNHEFGATSGAMHAHGNVGSFISFWGINPTDKSVFLGRDEITSLVTNGPSSFGRFCSGDLPDRIAFWPNATANSSEPYIYTNGEETGDEGRAMAHVLTGPQAGTSFELPWLGKASWENIVARPYASPKTVVIGLDDTTPGQVYVYVGDKQPSGTVIQRAGLENGTLYGVKVPGVPLEDRLTGLGGVTTFQLGSLGDVSGLTGAQIQANSVTANITQFLRPEDGSWDPMHPTDFYFVTTDRFQSGTTIARSRLWRLRFSNIDDVTLGGQISILLDGTEGQQMFDNICLDRRGHVLLEEDVGNNAHIGKIWMYDIATGVSHIVLQHDPARFVAGGASFLTQDEEASGIFDASRFLGPGWFITGVQAHASNPDPELVEHGQLVAIFIADSQ